MAKHTQSYDYTTVIAENTFSMNIGDKVRFHAFNPRGLVAEQGRIDDVVRALVEAGTVKSGAMLAYGSLDHFYHDAVMGMLDRKPTANRLGVILKLYAERNARARAFVVDNRGSVAEPVIKTVAEVRRARDALVAELLGG